MSSLHYLNEGLRRTNQQLSTQEQWTASALKWRARGAERTLWEHAERVTSHRERMIKFLTRVADVFDAVQPETWRERLLPVSAETGEKAFTTLRGIADLLGVSSRRAGLGAVAVALRYLAKDKDSFGQEHGMSQSFCAVDDIPTGGSDE